MSQLIEYLIELEELVHKQETTENNIERLRKNVIESLTRRRVKFTINETLRITYKIEFGGDVSLTPVSLIPNIDYVLGEDGLLTTRQGVVLNVNQIPNNIDLITLANAIKHAYD